ncbi:MAG: FKBP-type peptidyl-prolyl cis-trans isomerase [Bacteroidales bacterium]
MKKTIKLFTTVSIVSILLFSCSGGKSEKLPGITQNLIDSTSYSVGVALGSMVEQSDFGKLNMKLVYKAIADVLEKNNLKIDAEETNTIITSYLTKRGEAVREINLAEAKVFFDENRVKEGVVETESGLQYKILSEGNDKYPGPKDTIKVNYSGRLLNGVVFDSTYAKESSDEDRPITIILERFIKGWVEGMQKVGEGGSIELYIPSSLGYGNQPAGEIGPGSTLVFKVDLLEVKKAVEAEE